MINKEDVPLITPLTKFAVLKEIMNETTLRDEESKQETYHVRNITNDFVTHYHAFKGVIFEVMPEFGDHIASVILF